MMMRYRTRERSSISAFRRDDDGAPQQQRFARSDDPVTHRHKSFSLSRSCVLEGRESFFEERGGNKKKI
jgi:hypothetical protein